MCRGKNRNEQFFCFGMDAGAKIETSNLLVSKK
jgi:hypothetical protein